MRQPSHQPHLVPGTRLGEWIIDSALEAGRFATLYAGHGTHLGEPVVVKEYFPAAVARRLDGRIATLDAPGAADRYAEALERFIVQARLLRGLCEQKKPPHVAAVRSVIKANNTAYMVMAKVDGAPLGDPARLGAEGAESLIRRLGAALALVHEAGVVHGHIVPRNILIDADGEPTLIGFGAIRFDTGDAKRLTPFTPPYAALEQYVSAYPTGPWTDIYALGVIAYQAITGQTPPEVIGRTGSPRNRKLAAGEWPGASRQLLEAVDAAMQIAPQERPQSVAAWLAMLDAGAPAPAETPASPAPAKPRTATDAAVLMPLFPTPTVVETVAEPLPSAAPPRDWRIPARLRAARRLAVRHRTRLAVGAALTVGAVALVTALSDRPSSAVGDVRPTLVAAAPAALSPAAADQLAAARERHGGIVRHADAQAKAVAADLWTLRDRTRMLSSEAATVMLGRADAAQATVDGALARLSDTTRQLAAAASPADAAPLLESAAAAGRGIDAERRAVTRLLADADAAAQTAADGARRDTQRAALDRALAEARQAQAQVTAALGPSTPPALRTRAAEAGANLDRQAKLAGDPNASRAALQRATRSVQASRRTLSALLTEAARPAAAAAAPRTTAAPADEQAVRLARQASRAYDDVNREYMALRSRIERAYKQRPSSDPDVVVAYAAATEVHRGLLDLAPRRDAIAAAPTHAEAERLLTELKAALKPLDKRLDGARRALQR